MAFKNTMGQIFKVMTNLSPTGQLIRNLNRSGFNPPLSPTPNSPSLSGGPKGGRGGKSRGISISELERKHPLAQADKGKAQYSKGGKVSYKSVFDME